MRLWSLHPRYLDATGLVALWREGLLAQKVLAGDTRGYRRHPQLERFRTTPEPLLSVGAYLQEVKAEADRRGYSFDGSLILTSGRAGILEVTDGQLLHEWRHLMEKLSGRSPSLAAEHSRTDMPMAHPLFVVVRGPVANWERLRREAR